MYNRAVKCRTDEGSAVQCSAVQCRAVQCGAVQYSAVRCSAVQCGAVRCSAVQCGAVRCSAHRCLTVSHTPCHAGLKSLARPKLKGTIEPAIPYKNICPLLARPLLMYKTLGIFISQSSATNPLYLLALAIGHQAPNPTSIDCMTDTRSASSQPIYNFPMKGRK